MFSYLICYVIGKHFRAILILGTIGMLWKGYTQPTSSVPTPAQPIQVQSK